ncbi:putative quinate permease [Fusarium oxysporum]|nr:putative quinate permease [Fusarium oxysporum]
MGILTLAEDRPTPPSVYNWRIYVLAVVASCGSNMIGYTSAFIGTTITLDSFKKEFGIDTKTVEERNLISENIVSLFIAGAFFGALLTYVLSHWVGRKWCLAIASATFTLGAGLQCGADSSTGLGILYAGRVLSGLGTGFASNIIPIYISELAPPAIRGRLVGLYELGWQIGGLVGFWINYGVQKHMPESHQQWIVPFAVQIIPSGLLFLGTLWLRESPRWLFLKDRRTQAMENLCWIRQLPPTDLYITEEPFQALKDRPNMMWRLFLGCMLFFWQNGSGINAINYYSPTVFSSIGVQHDTVNVMTGIFGVVKAVMTFVWLLFLVDQLGRRSFCLLVVSPVPSALVLPLSCSFYLWTAVYTPTWNGTPWVINSVSLAFPTIFHHLISVKEFFDPSFRSLAQACTTASNWLFNFLVSRFTEQMFAAMGYGVYMFFATLSFFAFIFAFFLIPETSGIPLEQVYRLFKIKPIWKADKILKEQLKQEEQQFRSDVKGEVSQSENLEDVSDKRGEV